jgi:broad specificity polyphosphatase/5'/3'-nucleotidase SurE
MKLTGDEARDVVYDNSPDWEQASSRTIVDQSRWETFYDQVFKNKTDNKFYQFDWSEGSTEEQDTQAYEYQTEYEPVEVEEVEVTVKQWQPVMRHAQ